MKKMYKGRVRSDGSFYFYEENPLWGILFILFVLGIAGYILKWLLKLISSLVAGVKVFLLVLSILFVLAFFSILFIIFFRYLVKKIGLSSGITKVLYVIALLALFPATAYCSIISVSRIQSSARQHNVEDAARVKTSQLCHELEEKLSGIWTSIDDEDSWSAQGNPDTITITYPDIEVDSFEGDYFDIERPSYSGKLAINKKLIKKILLQMEVDKIKAYSLTDLLESDNADKLISLIEQSEDGFTINRLSYNDTDEQIIIDFTKESSDDDSREQRTDYVLSR